jgi:hypothetical protein
MRFKSHGMVVVGTVFLLGITSCSGGDGIAAIDRARLRKINYHPMFSLKN